MKARCLFFSFIVFPVVLGCTRGSPYPSTVFLQGDPQQIGLAEGVRFKPEIQELFRAWLQPKLDQIPYLLSLFAQWKTGSMNFPPDSIAEAQGIAQGAEVEPTQIFEATASPDLMTLAGTPFGCSTLAVMPARSASGGMLVGHNLDFPDSTLLRKHWTPILYAKTGALRILSIQAPGMVGVVNAINERGVLGLVHMVSGTDTNSRNMPVLVDARQALERATSAREAIQIYLSNPSTVPMNLFFADGREAYVLEITAGGQNGVRQASPGGTLACANHFATPEMVSLSNDAPDERWPILTGLDSTMDPLSLDDVRTTIGNAGGFHAAGGDSNVLAVFVDYGAWKLIWGSDPDGNDRSAFGKLQEIDLGTVFP